MTATTRTQLETAPVIEEIKLKNGTTTKREYKWELNWRNIILYLLMHVTAFYGVYLMFTSAKILTIMWAWFMAWIGLQGITSGIHRLWAHRTYKAKLPLRILLMIFQTISLQHHIMDWATDHRVHHKYVDTDADPHNSKRGFFFCHVGWLFIKKLPEVAEKIRNIDVSDLEADPVVMFQKKYYHVLLAPVFGFLMPAAVPWYFWNEDFTTAFFVATMFRYCLTTHITFMVNSFAHMYGTRPYDKNIRPVENLTVAILTGGEGWHNYHHTFPWDYKAGEFGHYKTNTSTAFIDFMAALGWAYDLKSVSREMLVKRVNRTGDGSRSFPNLNLGEDHTHNLDETLWGWGDKDMTKEHMNYVKVDHHKDD